MQRLAAQIDGPARPLRDVLDIWHNHLFHSLPPIDYYAGNMRSDTPGMPCLAQNVWVGALPGVPYPDVASEIATFEIAVDELLVEMEKRYRNTTDPDMQFLFDAVGWITAEFIRIHPYINGNGRISRFVTNALLHRFGFRLDSIRINPRPDFPYSRAGQQAMLGNWKEMSDFILLSTLGIL